jgi:hypothetical protein
MEPHRPALAKQGPETLRPCGGYIGPGLLLVARRSKDATGSPWERHLEALIRLQVVWRLRSRVRISERPAANCAGIRATSSFRGSSSVMPMMSSPISVFVTGSLRSSCSWAATAATSSALSRRASSASKGT